MQKRRKTINADSTKRASRRSLLKIAGAGAVSVVGLPFIRTAQAARPLKIGSIQSITGPSSAPGIRGRDGSLVAIRQIQDAGGFSDNKGNSYTLSLENEDMGNDPKQAIALFRQYSANPDIISIVGPTTSVGFLPCIPVARQLQIPLVGNGSGAPVKNWNPWAYRVNPVGQIATEAMIRKATAAEKARRLAIIYEATHDTMKGDAEVARELKDQLGYEIVAYEACRTNDQDFSAQIARLKEGKPDLIFISAQHATAAQIVRQCRSAGLKTPVLTGYGAISYGTVWDASDGGVVGSYTWLGVDVASATGKLKDWVDKYNATFSQEATSEAVYAYDAIYTVVESIKRAGTADRSKIQQAMASLDFISPLGTRITFKNPPHGDNLTPTVTVVRVTGRAKYDVVN
jgi:branched-chain amino acid transport system substrate-binding protein